MPGAASIVTGISPKEGPPGTRVTIRGENLGINAQDLIGLSICGVDCLLSADWKAPNKIIARSGAAKGRGDVIVTTRSGGRGTCTIHFRSYSESIGPLKESAVWVDESHLSFGAWGRKRAVAPSPLHQDNPLGLADEGNEKKCSEEELHEYFPEGSGSLTSENFVPAWFLLENHGSATFNDLRAGLHSLRHKLNTQKEELSFLKSNVGAVIDQLDTLNALRTKMQEEEGFIPHMVDTLQETIIKSRTEESTLFEDVLGQKERADATRNALSVLQRFKFIFNLPCSIERNIQKGDYDIVINDFARAKLLFRDTDVQLFIRVYHEVEKRISSFREMLAVRLKEPTLTLSEQTKLIGYLLNLEAAGDPAWDCIVHQHEYAIQSLMKCKDVHRASTLDLPLMEDIHLLPFKIGLDRQHIAPVRSDTWTEQPLQQIVFVEAICRMVTDWFPDLWKLSQAYFSGDLLVKEVGEKLQSVDPKRNHKKFQEMVLELISLFANLVRSAVMPETFDSEQQSVFGIWPDASNSVQAWFPQCILYVRSTYIGLIQLDLPGDALDVVQQLLFDLRLHCFRLKFEHATKDVTNLGYQENWILQFEDDASGTTQLPILFENIVTEAVHMVQDAILQTGEREVQLFSYKSLEEEATALWGGLVKAFPQTLQQLIERRSQVQTPNKVPAIKNMHTAEGVGSASNGGPSVSQEHKLLILLSNCSFTKEHIMPRLMDLFKKHMYPNVNQVDKEVCGIMDALDREIFETYFELKCDPIIGAIEQGMYVGRFDWNGCLFSNGVRSYAKEILISMIFVQAEVCSVTPKFVPRVLKRIVESVAEELSRLFTCVSKFSAAGAVQARMDLIALRDALAFYRTPSANKSFQEALGKIRTVTNEDGKKTLEDGLSAFKTRMRFQLMCFKSDSSSRL